MAAVLLSTGGGSLGGGGRHASYFRFLLPVD